MPALLQLWPKAKFVHIYRDGRDVCLCAAERWKDKPGFKGFPFFLYEQPDRVFDTWNDDPVITAALWWEWNVRLGRELGRTLGPEMFHEMRYEDLVADPETESIRLCEFLGVPFDTAMLRHEKNFKPRLTPKGTILHASVGLPVTPGLRNWRSEMPLSDLNRFEASAGLLLDELGYSRGSSAISTEDMEEAARVRAEFEKFPGVRISASAPLATKSGEAAYA